MAKKVIHTFQGYIPQGPRGYEEKVVVKELATDEKGEYFIRNQGDRAWQHIGKTEAEDLLEK